MRVVMLPILACLSCAPKDAAPLQLPPTPNTFTAILMSDLRLCGYSAYGLRILAAPDGECVDAAHVDPEVEFLLDLTDASRDTFEGSELIFTGRPITCGGTAHALGCQSSAWLAVYQHSAWRRTLRHELEHRRREILYNTGRYPDGMDEAQAREWSHAHTPRAWWAIVERGRI